MRDLYRGVSNTVVTLLSRFTSFYVHVLQYNTMHFLVIFQYNSHATVRKLASVEHAMGQWDDIFSNLGDEQHSINLPWPGSL